MTAKSRRHKLDKRRKSDEHPHPRHVEEAGRRSESTRSRTGLIPRKREGNVAADESAEQAPRTIGKAKLRSVSLVPEGQGFPGSSIRVEIGNGKGGIDKEALSRAIDFIIPDDLEPVYSKVEEGDYYFAQGWGGKVLWVTDQERAVFDEAQRKYEEGVRTAGASNAEASA